MVATSPLYVFQDKISSDNGNQQQQQQQPQQRSSRRGIGTNKQQKKTTKRRSNTVAGGSGSGNSGTTTVLKKDTKKPITKSIKKSIRNQIQKIKKSASSSSKTSKNNGNNKGHGTKGGGKVARDIVDVNDGILYPPHNTSSVAVVKKKATTKPKSSKKSSTSQSPSKSKKTIKKKSSAEVAVVPSPQSSSLMRKKKAVTSSITKQDQPKPIKTKKSKKKTSAPITTSDADVELKRSRGKEKSHHNRYNKSLFSQSSTYDDDDYSSFDNDKGSSFFSGDSDDDGSGSSSSGSSSSSNSDGGNDDDDDSDSSSLYDGLESFVSSDDDDDDNNSSAGSDDDGSRDSVSSSDGSSSSYCTSEDDVRTKTERGASFRNPSASIVGGSNSRSQSRRGRSRNPRPRVESLVTVASATASVASTAALISSPRRNQPKQKQHQKQQQQPSYDDSDSDVLTNSDDSSYISEGTSYDDSDDGSKSQSEYYTTSYDSDRNNNTTFDDTDRDDTDRDEIEQKRHHHLPSSTFGSEETERTNLTSSNFIKRRCGVSSDGMITATRSRDSITVINDFTMSNDNDDDDNNDAINGGEEEDETNTLPAASFSTFGSTEEDQKEFEAFVKDQNEIEKIELDLKRLLAEKRQEELSVILKIKQQKEQKEKEIADAADASDENNSTVSGWGSWLFSGFGGGSLPPTIAEPVGAGAGDNDVVGILGSYKKGSGNNNETTTPVSPSSSSAMVAKKNIDEEKAAPTTIHSPRRKGANVKDFNDGDNDDGENSIAVRDDRRTTFSTFDSNKNGRNTTYIAFDNGMMNQQQHQQEGELENVVTSAGCGCDMNHILDGEESIAESYGGLRNGEFLLSNHTDSFSQQDQHEQEQRNDDGDNNNDIVEQLSVTMRGSATFDDEDDENEGNDNANNNTPQEISFAPKKEKNSNDSKRVTATTETDDNANDGEDDTSSFSYCCFPPNQDPPTLIRKEQLLTGAQTKPEGRADGVDGLFSSSVTLGQEFERRTSKYGGIDNNTNSIDINSNGSNNHNIDAVSTLGGDDYHEEDDATCASTINTQAYCSQELFKDMKTNTADLQRPSSRLELASMAAQTIATNGVVGDGPTGGAEESDHFVMIPVDTEDYEDDNEDDSICAEDIEIELGSCGGGHDINDENDVDVSEKADSDNNNNSPTRRRIQAECLENYDISEIVHGRRAFKSKKNEDGSLISTTLPSTNPSERRARRQSALKAHRDFLYGSYSKDTFIDIPADKDSRTAEENEDVISNTKGDDGGESYVAEDKSKAIAVPDGSGDHQQQHETTSTIPSVNEKGGNSSDLTTHTNSILQDDATLPADDSKPDALMELVRNAFTVMMSPDGNTAAAISATPHHKSAPKTEYVNDNDTDAGSTDGVQGKESTINTASSNSAENAWGVAYNFFGTKKDETPLILESQNDLENEEGGALKCNDYNPSPVTRPTAIHSEASGPISTTSGGVVKIPSDIPSKMSNSSAPSGNITKESRDMTKISDEQILATDPSPKATRVSRSTTKNNNARFNSDGIPLQLSPKKIWRAFDSGFVAASLSTTNTEATSLPMSDFLSSPVIVEENKTTNDDNVKQKDQEDTSCTPANDVRSPKKKVPTEKKSSEDEPAKRKLSSRYRKHSDLLRMKNRRFHKNNKSPEIQRHSNNCSEFPQEEEKAATERHDETKSPSNQQRSQNRSPTKERPQSKELVVSKDDKCYTKTNDETSEIATQTATEDELAASPSKTKPSSSPSHNLADIRSRIKQRRRTKMFSKSNYHHKPQKDESNNNATTSSSPSTSPLKLRSSTSKNTSKSEAVTTNNTKTRKTKSRVESRNDSDASKDLDHDEFYDALTFDDDDIHNDGAPDNERGGDDVTTTEQHHLSLSSKETNPNVVVSPLIIPKDQERDFAAICYKESTLSGVMSLD